MSTGQGFRGLALSPPLLLLLGLLQATGVYGATSRSGSGCTSISDQLYFCVNATVVNDVATYELTSMRNDPEHVGWMAIGFGENMVNSHMVIMWQNEDKTMTVSQRYARWYSEPFVLADPPRNATAIEPKLTAWQPKTLNTTTFAFEIPAEASMMNGTTKHEQLIWAVSPMRPGKSYLSHIARHWEKGHLRLQYEDPAPPPPTRPTMPSDDHDDGEADEGPHPGLDGHHDTDEKLDSHPAADSDNHKHSPAGTVTEEKHPHDHSGHERYVHWHAYLLSFGLLFALPMGVLAGRWGRTLSPVWFKVHSILNLCVAGPAIVLGWVLGPVSVFQHSGPHLGDPHKICGVVMLFLYIGQVLLGRFIHRRRVESTVPITNHHPPLNIAHVAFGLLFIAFAFFQVRSGLQKLSTEEDEAPFARWYHKLWAIWAVVLPLLYLVGLTLLPRQWRQERSGTVGASASGTYVQLGETAQREMSEGGVGPSSSTRLLFEDATHVLHDEDDDDEEEDDDVFANDEKKAGKRDEVRR